MRKMRLEDDDIAKELVAELLELLVQARLQAEQAHKVFTDLCLPDSRDP